MLIRKEKITWKKYFFYKKLLEETGKIKSLIISEIPIEDFIFFLTRDALLNQCSPEYLIKEDFLQTRMGYAFSHYNIKALSIGLAEETKEKLTSPHIGQLVKNG